MVQKKATKVSPSAQRAATPALHPCPLFLVPIGEQQCHDQTSVYSTNERVCMRIQCTSPWRLCFVCVRQGSIGKHSRVVDPKTGLCEFHSLKGADVRKPQPYSGAGISRVSIGAGGGATTLTKATTAPVVPQPSRNRQEQIPSTRVEAQQTTRPAATPTSVRVPTVRSGAGRTRIPPVAQVIPVKPPAPPDVPQPAYVPPQAEAAPAEKSEVLLPVGRIRPFAGQPRKFFDPVKLRQLAGSIKKRGQLTAIDARLVSGDPEHDYELIDGERRWRACKLAAITQIRAIVYPELPPEMQKVISFLKNFAHEDLAEIEAGRGIQEVMQEMGLSAEEIAEEAVKSVSWVRQRLSLLKLHPDVQALLDPGRPEAERLLYSIALQLAPLPQELQCELAAVIVRERMRFGKALHFIRHRARQAGVQSGTGRRRQPKDDFKNLQKYLERVEEGANLTLALPDHDLAEMFRYRDPVHLVETMRRLEKNLQLLSQVLSAFKRILEQEFGVAKEKPPKA